ncbi:hypothetical protein Tco_0461892 [Tanacetum coccineum]
MSTLTFADTHNMVAFLDQPAESDGFHEIIDFMNANQIRYALTLNPTIYTSCIKQFWATTKVKTVNGERQVQALIDKKKVIITETSIRSDLYLEDAGGIPTDSQQTPITSQLSSSRSQKKQSRRKHRKDTAVLDLEKAKDDQAKEITDLKKRVQKLERKKKSRTTGLQRLRKVGMSRRVESSKDRRVWGRSDDEEMFNINNLHSDEVNVDMPVGEKQEQSAKEREVNTSVEDSATPTTIKEITLAQTLIQIKAAKPKVVTIAATTTTTIRPKARGVVVQELIPLKRKDQVALDEDLARNLQAQLEDELMEKERLARKQEEEASIALIE